MLLDEEIVEEKVNPALIAMIQDVSTLGLMTVTLGKGFFPPPGDSLEKISQYLELALLPTSGSNAVDPSKL